MSFDYKKILPHFVAVLVFYFIVATYFSPYFSGYELKQDDVSRWRGMAKEIHDHRYSENEDPKWTNSMFGGMPAYQITNEDNSNKLKWIHKISSFNMKNGFGNILVAFLGFYILLILVGVNPWLSIGGGIAFGLSTYNIIILVAGHNTKLAAIGWLPAVLGAILFIYKTEKRELLGLLILSLFMGLEVNSNHVQITYYLGGLVGIIIIHRLIESILQSKISVFIRKTALVVLAVLIGIMCNFGLLYNTYKYSKQTIRGKSELIAQKDKEKELEAKKKKGRNGLDFEYITNWSLGKEETISVFLANVKGGASNEILASLDGVKEDRNIRELKGAVTNYYRNNSSQVNNGGYIKSYWGDQPFTSGPIYMGITVFLLFLIGLVLDKGYLRWIAISATVIFVLLAWGKNFEGFNRWVVDYLPLYNKFRAVSMTMVIVQVLLPLIGFWGLHLLIKKRDELKLSKILYPVGALILVLLIFLLNPESFLTFTSKSEASILNSSNPNRDYVSVMDLVQEYRIDFFKDEVKRALMYVFLIGGTLFSFIKLKFNSKILIALIIGFVLSDLWTANINYQNNSKNRKTRKYKHWSKNRNKNVPYLADKADISIADQEFDFHLEFKEKYIHAESVLKDYKESEGKKKGLKPHEKQELRFKVIRDNTHYRVLKLGNPFNDASVSYFHKSVGGYHAAKLMRYQELIENAIHSEMSVIQRSFSAQDINVIQRSMMNTPVLNMLNTKYIIYNKDAPPIRNDYSNGSAWAVKELIFVDNPNEEIERVGNINSKTQALVDKRFKAQFKRNLKFGDFPSEIKLQSVKSNELNYAFESKGNQLMIFSDIYYEDGWNAYIDGNIVDHFRANYVLRGLYVPAGKHKIDFKFEPKSVSIGMMINSIFSLIILLGLAYLGFKEIKNYRSKKILEAT